MVKRCDAAGCSSTTKDGVHLYGFPKDPGLRKKWGDQVKRTRDKWEPTDHSCICSKHFEETCFQPYSKFTESLGMGKVRALLKPGGIPTIFERSSPLKRSSRISFTVEPAAKKKKNGL